MAAPRGVATSRRRGQHGPRKGPIDDLVEFARKYRIIGPETTDEEWAEALKATIPNIEKDRRYRAWLRRYWWTVNAYEWYCDRLEGVSIEDSKARPIPPEIDPDLVPLKRRHHDAIEVAELAYRHRRDKMPYTRIAKDIANRLAKRTKGDEDDEEAGPLSADDIRKAVDADRLIWELAEAATGS